MPIKIFCAVSWTAMKHKTPAACGYSMPSEWTRHEATWLTWPDHPKHWKPLAPVQTVYEKIIAAVSEGERVSLLVKNAAAVVEIKGRFRSRPRLLKNLRFFKIPTGDIWVRDYGPTFLTGPRLGAVKWIFNAWGGKYADLAADGRVARKIASLRRARLFCPPAVLEGGAVEVNGKGVAMATRQCLLNPNRNPRCTEASMEKILKDYLGVAKVLWLEGGIAGDDTDGHVDEVARFAGPRTIMVATASDRSDPNRPVLKENLRLIRRSADAHGRPWKIVELPLPRLAARAPASYANFYIANAAVLVPQFGVPEDRAAVRIFKKLFPRLKIAPIECRALIAGLGGIHCITQQEPRSRTPSPPPKKGRG